MPRNLPGANYVLGGTLYGAEFNFTCYDGFVMTGNNSAGNNLVTCMADGHWDLGSLQCTGNLYYF